MLRTRATFADDFLNFEWDEISTKGLGNGEMIFEFRDGGLLDFLTTACWDKFDNIQAIYGVSENLGGMLELSMVISPWIKSHYPTAMARFARKEVARLAGEHDKSIWVRGVEGQETLPAWFGFLGFKETRMNDKEGLTLWEYKRDVAAIRNNIR